MRSIIQWAIKNSPAMNTLMIGTLAVGMLSLLALRRETFPEFDTNIILITVAYPGASPAETEEGICQKLEEAVRPIDGIKKQFSVARESSGFLIIELNSDVADTQQVLGEIRSAVDRIPNMPRYAEDPEIELLTLRQPAIRVGVIGPESDSPESEWLLREITEEVRSDLLQLPSVSQANILGAKDYQIDIEISEAALRKHALTLQQVAQIVRRQNVELPGGNMKTDSQEVLLRSKNRHTVGEEIAKIPLVTHADGVVLTAGDLGEVRDAFADATSISRITSAEDGIDDRPGLAISVERTSNEDLLAIVEEVREYLRTKELPAGYQLRTWDDQSVDVRDRMELLTRNGLSGLLLVFLTLAVFLDLRLAFWVSLGIPVAVLGAAAVLLMTGNTLNMLTMFAFLMALGIVVDDAIVIGENIYAHRQQGKGLLAAAADGTVEVLPSVLASVSTTIVAFSSLLFVAGMMGKFIAVLPVAIIAMLIISLVESMFILPMHLGHESRPLFRLFSIVLFPLRPLAYLSRYLNRVTHRLIDRLIARGYLPALRWSLRHRTMVICGATAMLIATLGLYRGGITPWSLFPKMDNKSIHAKITFPDGTPARVTDAATQKLQAAIQQINREHLEQEGTPLLRVIHRSVGMMTGDGPLGPESRSAGSHVGSVTVELIDPLLRTKHSQDILADWRALAGEFAGHESLVFGTPSMGPGGAPVEFKLLAHPDKMATLEKAAEECKVALAGYAGVLDIRDDSRPGKWELQPSVKDHAKAMGVTEADLAETIRASYYGEEVMRLQRGRHEVKLMVRYPRQERHSLAGLDEIRIRTGDGSQRPIAELADFHVERGYAEINRLDQLRSITVTTDIDETRTTSGQVVKRFKGEFLDDLLARYPDVRIRWEGQSEQTQESVMSLIMGFFVAIVCMFVLLTIEFRSYIQPLLVLLVIPFGAIGAIWGHALMGLPLTMFTLFGFIALTGVIVNDSIVLIDFINKRISDGAPIHHALIDAGRRRFLPVLLTSITTVAGLLPILTERSFQAQILIPMAAALCFGLMGATAMILILVPTFYSIYHQAVFGRSTEPIGLLEDGRISDARISDAGTKAALEAELADGNGDVTEIEKPRNRKDAEKEKKELGRRRS